MFNQYNLKIHDVNDQMKVWDDEKDVLELTWSLMSLDEKDHNLGVFIAKL